MTGFVVEDLDTAVEATMRAATLDRRRCREGFEARFTASRMARDYVAIYETLTSRTSSARRHEPANRRTTGGVMPHRLSVAPGAGGDNVEIDPFYILPPATLVEERGLVLKQDDTFALFDRFGDIRPGSSAHDGIYHEGTRYLSRLGVRLGSDRPLLLSSAVTEDNSLIAVDLTNVDVVHNDVVIVPRGTHPLVARLRPQSGSAPGTLHAAQLRADAHRDRRSFIEFDADYADIFEVRGTRRPARGQRLPAIVEGDTVILGYRGLDQVVRRTAADVPARAAAGLEPRRPDRDQPAAAGRGDLLRHDQLRAGRSPPGHHVRGRADRGGRRCWRHGARRPATS